ncbi:MAG: UDP-3-O-(3-hydroxymyristoyl)glucosamine N-acyltransferase [Bacillota bacterium]
MRYQDVEKLYHQLDRESRFKKLGLVDCAEENTLTFCENDKYVQKALSNKNIAAIITNQELAHFFEGRIPLIAVENPRQTFFRLHNYLASNTGFYGAFPERNISSSARIHPGAYISDRVVIGKNVVIEPGVIILDRVIIEDNVIVRAGSVIGAEGFEYKRTGDEIWPVIHAGGVWIKEFAEIGASNTLANATFGGYTIIGEHTKTDSLVYIAHDCVIGKRCLIGANASIMGRVLIKNDVWIGPSSSISHQIEIGDNASITLGSVVTKNIGKNEKVSGNFAISHNRFIEFIRSIR